MSRSVYFSHRHCAVASKHKKEIVIAPILSEALGVNISTVLIDTDIFGTFTGEIPRTLTPVDALRAKCDLAFQNSGVSLIVASEGSFGPHPSLYFVPANEEFMMLKDYENDIEIIARYLTVETNYMSAEIHSSAELISFTEKCGFPDHAIILSCRENLSVTQKGISDQITLLKAYERLKVTAFPIVAETDMRAMNNPTRMRAIQNACHELVRKIENACPNCEAPGFDMTVLIPGLPCRQCYSATKTAIVAQYSCKKCGFKTEKKFPFGKEWEDPMFCDFCNP